METVPYLVGFFFPSNPLDQREKNLVLVGDFSFIAPTASGELEQGAARNDGCHVGSRGFTALAFCPSHQRFLWLAVEMHEGFIKTNRCK